MCKGVIDFVLNLLFITKVYATSKINRDYKTMLEISLNKFIVCYLYYNWINLY